MEKLTYRDLSDNKVYFRIPENSSPDEILGFMQKVMDRLNEYEETGYDPTDILVLKVKTYALEGELRDLKSKMEVVDIAEYK